MAKKKDNSSGEIQRLLEERRQVEQWLQRLEMAADKTPSAVRERVRGDYEERLTGVVEQLQGYGDDLRASLADQQGRRSEFKQQEHDATEELAEAELRHAVGEFGESAWREKKSAILERLIGIREGLAETEEEIGQLEEVLAALEAPAAPPPEAHPVAADEDIEDLAPPPPPAKAAPAPERHSLGAELGLRHLGPSEPAPAAGRGRKGAAPTSKPAGEIGDELAFLKAVSEDKGHGPSAARASGATKAIPEVEKLADQKSVSRSQPSAMNQRTLKCGECGAMNLPTEWYCDRCGAELAAL